MKHYNITIGHWDGYTDYEIDIPEEVCFFYRDGAVGHMLKNNCNHYTTIVEKDIYKDWLSTLHNKFFINIYFCDIYAIVYISNLHNDTPIPTIDRLEWFERNNINLNRFVFVTYSENYIPIAIHRIIDFIDPTSVNCIHISKKHPFYDDTDMFGINISTVEYNSLEPDEHFIEHSINEILDGDEANTIYNSCIRDILDKINYNSYFVTQYDYNSKRRNKVAELEEKIKNLEIIK